MTLEELAGIFATLTAIIGFVVYITKPVVNSFTKINSNLTDITHSLDLINKSIEQSQTDRNSMHEEIKRNNERLDDHDVCLAHHDEQIKTLFNRGDK